MVFASLTFLYIFLPLFFVCYFLAYNRIKIQNIIICIFSIIFYAWGEPVYIFLLLISVAFNFYIGKAIDKETTKNKTALIIGVVFDVLIIFIFKYLNFFTEILNICHILPFKTNISLPIGISFYTFQTISYLVDVYRGDVSSQKKFSNLLLYISMFPQLIAGPIVRYKTIEENIYYRSFDVQRAYTGVQRIITGVGKKVILANQLSTVVESLLVRNLLEVSIVGKFVGIALYGFQLYFDFSGYSDIAIGIGKVIGFKFEENFKFPFVSTSMNEFWRRWHMSLGTFFRDYVYIPLGGNRKHQVLNIAVVWILTGMWHGATLNYLLWGVFLFIVMLLEKFVLKIEKVKLPMIIKMIYTIIILTLMFAIFYFEDITNFGRFVNIWKNGFVVTDFESNMYILNNLYLIIVSVLCASPLVSNVFIWLKYKTSSLKGLYIIYNVIICVIMIAILVVSTIMLVGETNNPFLYTRF